MEIEAKFAVPDEVVFARLKAADRLGDFVLSAAQVKEVYDTYLDTVGRVILAAGYACRQRKRDGTVLITLKGLGTADDAVHRREELEIQVVENSPPADWPAGPVRERVLQWVGEANLVELFDLQQTRIVRSVIQPATYENEKEERVVAEWSLDHVRVGAGGQTQAYFELELELVEEFTEDDLLVILACLQDEYHLGPECLSKFERGLAFVDAASTQSHVLSSQERGVCQQIALRDDMYGRRARALLALDEGMTQVEASSEASLSDRRVRHWLAAFREKGLDVFPARILDWAQDQSGVEIEPAVVPVIKTGGVDGSARPEPWPIQILFDHYQVDQVHARTVADHALVLFDHLLPLHGLAPERRSLLEIAALLHNVGLETDPGVHHVAGRDILRAHPPAELGDVEGRVVALTTFLHRKRITARKLVGLSDEPLYADLPDPVREEALGLASLVRLADGLDYSQTGTSQLGQIEHRTGEIVIDVAGPYAGVDAGRAQRKSDLWRLLYGIDLRFEVAGQAEDGDSTGVRPTVAGIAFPEDTPLPDQPGLEPDDSMVEAARKTLLFHFRRMLHHEPGTRLGEDIEELHDMRVATRRMRASLRVFGEYLDMARMKPFVKGMRRTGRTLGAVRDLDVFWEKTQHYLDALPKDRQSELEPLRKVWEAEREAGRERMLTYLDSDFYRRFADRFGELLLTPEAWAFHGLSDEGEPLPHRLHHVVPVVVYQRLAAVRGYDEWVTGPNVPLERLHQLRIAAKGLRYTVEYFREVLGPEAKPLIDKVKKLQDHLGDLQDAVVASNLLRDFLIWGTWGHTQQEGKLMSIPEEPIVAPGVAIYLAARQVELQKLVDTFPQTWGQIQNPEFSQSVARVVATL